MHDDILELLLALDGVRQSPRHHPEGDALYHSLQAFELARRDTDDGLEEALAERDADDGEGAPAPGPFDGLLSAGPADEPCWAEPGDEDDPDQEYDPLPGFEHLA